MHRCALVCVSVWGSGGCAPVCVQVCVQNEFSEYLLETRFLTSANYSTHPLRIFFQTLLLTLCFSNKYFSELFGGFRSKMEISRRMAWSLVMFANSRTVLRQLPIWEEKVPARSTSDNGNLHRPLKRLLPFRSPKREAGWLELLRATGTGFSMPHRYFLDFLRSLPFFERR